MLRYKFWTGAQRCAMKPWTSAAISREPVAILQRLFAIIGMPRSGTTWLHQRLSRHSRMVCALDRIKEVHYFDWVDIGPSDARRFSNLATSNRHAKRFARLEWHAARIENSLAMAPGAGQRERLLEQLRRVRNFIDRFGESDAWYADQFAPGPGDWCLDTTPAYHKLSTSGLRRMMSVATGRRFVLLLRDPYRRALSGLQHRVARHGLEFADWDAGQQSGFCRDVVADGYAIPHIARICHTIPPEELCIVFSETMFAEPEKAVTKILGSAGLEFEPACMERAEAAPNPSPPIAVPPELRRLIFDETRPMAEGVRALGLNPPQSWDEIPEGV